MNSNCYINIRLFLLSIIIVIFTGCSGISATNSKIVMEKQDSGLIVQFIDVGQADCILIESKDNYMLIDAGNNDDKELILSYLKKQGITKFTYVIGSHPHEDHIGSLDSVIYAYDIDNLLLPNVAHTSKTFEDVITAAEEKNLQITIPSYGESYQLGNSSFQIISTDKDYGDNLNNWSIGIKLTYGATSFIMCGDMEKEAELDVIAAGSDLNANVLKVNHHGSNTSTSQELLDAVSPEFGIIMVGNGNVYGHPTTQTLERINQFGTKVLRTDLEGTIIAYSDGTTINWNVDMPVETADFHSSYYVINTNTKKFHLPQCSSITSIKPEHYETSELSPEELIKQAYSACKNCNP